MIREALEKLINEFPTREKKEAFPFAESPLADYIRGEIPKLFTKVFPEYPTLNWEASPGKGQWGDAPWIAVFDPAVTDSAQTGFYPVLLFTSSLDRVYLSLNQGMTKIREEFGKDAVNKLQQNAQTLRMRVGKIYSDLGFSDEPIDLQPRSNTDRLFYYQPGHAFGKVYEKGALPSEETLKQDIKNMLRLYALAFASGGISDLDDDEISDDDGDEDVKLQEKLRYTQHRSIERNKGLAKKAKKVHGYECQVCRFNFEKRYGDLGKEFIEAHHKVPLHMLPKDQFVALSPKDDFAVVCANCHRMIHRKNAPPDFDEFVKRYSG